MSVNLMRRHLDTSQRAMIVAQFATLAHGGDQSKKQEGKSTLASIKEAAALVNVSKDVVKDARTVLANATAEVIKQVELGHVAASRAAMDVTCRHAESRAQAETAQGNICGWG